MKHIKISIYLLFFALVVTSCEDFLTVVPQDSLVVEKYYTSEDAVYANSASLYGANIWDGFSSEFMWMAGDELAGDLFYTYSDEGQFYYMTFSNGNQKLTYGWNGLYRVISYCNNIINDMPDVALTNGVSEDVVNIALGEAHCIRGIAYYLLTEYWKDVPIVTDNTMSASDVVRYTQSSVYEFIRRDLVYASEQLPSEPYESGRVSKYTAIGMLSKIHLTMASHLDDADSDTNFALAKEYALQVINESSYSLYDDLSTMFYPSANNNSESIFAIQCTNSGYTYGNTRNVAHSRNSKLNLGNAWGGGKGPTLSLQEAFEKKDIRRKLTFMRNGDHYDNLAGGGYDYVNYSDDGTDAANEVLAHMRKYLIGTDDDCDGVAGVSKSDAGNNINILRLTDVYMTYIESCIGSGTSTDDAKAEELFEQIRTRAGLSWDNSAITYDTLIHERRVEFAFESINFFDIKRMSYRSMDEALSYLNGMERERYYYSNGQYTTEELNESGLYHGGFNPIDPADDDENDGKGTPYYLNPTVAKIVITESNLTLPVPAETVTKTPSITADPVDYQFND